MYRNGNARMEVASLDLAERAQKIASDSRISFGEALTQARREMALEDKVETQALSESQTAHKVARGAGSYVSVDSVVIRDKAMKVCRDRGLSFGEALRIVRHYTMADEVVSPAQIKSTVEAAIKDAAGKIMGGKEKVIGSNDSFQIEEAVATALSQLHIHSNVVKLIKSDVSSIFMAALDKDTAQAHMTPVEMDSLAATAAARAEAIYTKEIARLGGSTDTSGHEDDSSASVPGLGSIAPGTNPGAGPSSASVPGLGRGSSASVPGLGSIAPGTNPGAGPSIGRRS